MIDGNTREDIGCACGGEIPKRLEEILNKLDETIKDANGLKHGARDEYGIKSTQIIGVIVILWKLGILK